MKINKKQVFVLAALFSASINETSELVNEAEIANAYEIAMKDMKGEF